MYPGCLLDDGDAVLLILVQLYSWSSACSSSFLQPPQVFGCQSALLESRSRSDSSRLLSLYSREGPRQGRYLQTDVNALFRLKTLLH